VAANRQGAYLPGMSDLGFMTGADFPAPRKETAAAKAQRLAREAEMIAEARASVAAGRVVDSSEVKRWIDSIGTDHELPVPYSGR
jgi:hypothetical protein